MAACLAVSLCAAVVVSAQRPQQEGDNGITAVALRGGHPGGVTTILHSRRAITLVLPGIDPQRSTLGAQHFSLQSDRDPAYREPQPASRLGLDRQVTGFVDDRTAITETRVHLLFPHALRDGVPYRLQAPAAGLKSLPISWQARQPSDSIQLDQVGYLPVSRKLAYIGNWLGSAGPMPVDATDFRVIDTDSGDTVLQGKLALRAAADPWSGNDVYTADFSALHKTGNYQLRVPGLGQSDNFPGTFTTIATPRSSARPGRQPATNAPAVYPLATTPCFMPALPPVRSATGNRPRVTKASAAAGSMPVITASTYRTRHRSGMSSARHSILHRSAFATAT
jgi:hypothetical protein